MINNNNNTIIIVIYYLIYCMADSELKHPCRNKARNSMKQLRFAVSFVLFAWVHGTRSHNPGVGL